MSACLVVCAYVLAPTNPAVAVVEITFSACMLIAIAVAVCKLRQIITL